MTWAEGYYDSMYGRIYSKWQIKEEKIIYSATVPANTEATLYLPSGSEDTITENGKPAKDSEGVRFVRYEN